MNTVYTGFDDLDMKAAVESGDTRKVRELVEQGFNMKPVTSSWCCKPLLFSARLPAMAMVLVSNGVDINCTDDEGTTFLHYTMLQHTYANAPEMVRTLFRAGANASLPNNYGITAMDSVVYRMEVILSVNRCPSAATVVANLQRNVDALNDEMRMVAQTAFAMGHHARIGTGSMVMTLDPETMRLVLGYV